MSSLIYFVLLLAFLYAVTVVVIFSIQRKLIYFPVKDIAPASNYDLDKIKEEFITTADGETIQTWYQKPVKKDLPVILHFHGNADNIRNRAYQYRAFLKQGYGLLAVSWRGYAKSTGEPTEKGLYEDGRAAIHFLKAQGFEESRIVLFGESLGSGVAVQMATEYHPKALVLQAPYTSVWKRAQEIYWFLPVFLCVIDRFNSLVKIDKINTPLLVMHGTQDEVIPIHHGGLLFEKANEPKHMEIFDQYGHSDYDVNEVVAVVSKFLEKV